MLAATMVAVLVGVLVSHNNPASAQDTTAVAGTTITVNTIEDESTDDGNCSLREAIEAADTNTAVDKCEAGSATERDAIHFSLGKKATIVLGSQLPTITDASGLNINGRRAHITISGNDAVRVFEVGSGAKLTLANLTVADGFAVQTPSPNPQPDNGGGIVNDGGALRVARGTFSGNNANAGGGIANINGGTLTVTNSTFSGNNAVGTSSSGRINCENACFGGGIENDGGTLKVTSSTFSGNKADAIGGGISNNSGALKVANSTFSGNSAAFVGGAINNGGTLEVTYSTFSGNVGGGINNANEATAKVTLSNTILAKSTGGNIRQACAGGTCLGTITDGRYNISDDNTSSKFFTDPTSKNDTDPLLDPNGLQNNGGPTKTIALQKGSPAIDAIPEGANGCGTEVTTDQRGVKRPQGPGCDIGAFEKKK
jgi:CSLREA domain-containing protein